MKSTMAICCLSVFVLSAGVVHGQKPVREGMTSVLYKEPPASLQGLCNASDAIVVIRVTESHGVDTARPGGVSTAVTGTITEVIKPSPQIGPVGSTATFQVHGGEIDRGNYVERLVD